MSELRELADFWCGEDEGIEHVVACQDYACRRASSSPARPTFGRWPSGLESEARMSEPMAWHDEADRLATWGTLDPPDACMCGDCVLRDGTGD